MLSQNATNAGSALLTAAEYNQTEVVAALLSQNAETRWVKNKTHMSALHYAAQHDNVKMIINLREHNASEVVIAKKIENDLTEYTPIVLAASLQKWEAVKAFTIPINGKTNIAIRNTDSARAMLIAAGHNQTTVVKVLLQCNVETFWRLVNTHDTALHIAVDHGNIEMIMDLRSSGASETATNKNQQTPIQLATDIAAKKQNPRSLGCCPSIYKTIA